MWKMGCTRSGGPRFCTDRSEAETLDFMMKNLRNCGRWGEEERKKGSGNLFSSEPTDEAWSCRGDLGPWVQGTPRHKSKRLRLKPESFDFMRKMGLEPTRYCYHKILSLARLPVPTLPLDLRHEWYITILYGFSQEILQKNFTFLKNFGTVQ